MDRLEGYHHVDISPVCAPDQAWDLLDLSKRWPWQNISEIEIRHFVEHIPHGTGKDHFIRFFERCWHILKPGGTVTVVFPWYASIGAFSDPSHRRFITPLTFSYLSRAWLKSRNIEHYEMTCDFEVVSVVARLAEGLDKVDEAERGRLLLSTWNAAHEGVAVLRAIK